MKIGADAKSTRGPGKGITRSAPRNGRKEEGGEENYESEGIS